MGEMIERVADKMIERFKRTVSESSGLPFEDTKVAVPDRSIWIDYAKTALEAAREPTVDMACSGDEKIIEALNDHTFALRDPTPAVASWQAMVDEALK